MTLLRTTARTLLASYFVASGVKSVRNPETLVEVAEPVADRIVPLMKQYVPAQLANYVPEDTASLVRLNGALQVAGGVALASGKGRRLGAGLLAASLVPSTVAKHPFWKATSAEEKALERNQFLKNSSLLGGVLLASADTEGKPSLAWRAQMGTKQLTKGTSSLAKNTSALAKDTRQLADSAVAEGALLVGAVVAQSRRAQKRASKELASARKAAEQQAKVAAKRKKQRQKDAKKLSRIAAKEAAERDAARKLEAAERVAAKKREAAEELAARKRAVKAARNIQRGEN
jgi:uncharacterized membrane protein YphA (DoxX/SURF4 family)